MKPFFQAFFAFLLIALISVIGYGLFELIKTDKEKEENSLSSKNKSSQAVRLVTSTAQTTIRTTTTAGKITTKSKDIIDIEESIRMNSCDDFLTSLYTKSLAERLNLRDEYKLISNGKDLIELNICGNRSDETKLLEKYLLLKPFQIDAQQLKNEFELLDKDAEKVDDILCMKTDSEMAQFKKEYKSMYGNNLLDDIRFAFTDTNYFYYIKLLKILIESKRSNKTQTDENLTKLAQNIFESTHQKFEENFVQMIESVSFEQLGLVVNKYERLLESQTITGEINRKFNKYSAFEFNNDFSPTAIYKKQRDLLRNCLIYQTELVKDTKLHWARRLDESLKKGNKYDDIFRIIISHSEIDIKEIRDSFSENTAELRTRIEESFGKKDICTKALIKLIGNT